jgi:hypothetical protein
MRLVGREVDVRDSEPCKAQLLAPTPQVGQQGSWVKSGGG